VAILSLTGLRIPKAVLIPFIIAVMVGSYGLWQYSDRFKSSVHDPSDSQASDDVAPLFTLCDVDGTAFSLDQFDDRVKVLHFMVVGCEGRVNHFNEHQMRELSEICGMFCAEEEVAIFTVAISTCEGSELEEIREAYNITWIFGNDYDDGRVDIMESYMRYSIFDGSILILDESCNVVNVYVDEVASESLSSTINELLDV
jgi:hypothetical protein